MANILSYLSASIYGGLTSWFAASSSYCAVNGQLTTCDNLSSGFLGLGVMVWLLIELAIAIFMIVTMWKVFAKAGKPGWAAVIPFYNTYVMIKIAGKPGWWLVLYFVPFVNLVISIIVTYNIAKNFGQGGWFAVGLIFIPVVFYPVLAFGKATYNGDQTPVAPAPMSPQTPPIMPQQPIS